MDKLYSSLGFMSGTSLDGIDAALISTDGEGLVNRHGGISVPYDKALKSRLSEAAYLSQNAPEETWPMGPEAHMPAEIKDLESALVEAHIHAANSLLARVKWSLTDVDFIGFHGHTLLHRPEHGFTLQLGDGRILAEKMGITVVNALRLNDMAHGGQGAPLAPIYHQACVAQLINNSTINPGSYVFVNIGGVSNVTYIAEGEPLLAFDTGPGNALSDDWMLDKYGIAFDEDGKHARAGQANMAWVDQCLRHRYFSQKPPKSIDRDLFKHFLEALDAEDTSPEDGAASLAVLTAKSIALAQNAFPREPCGWIISGGGQHNEAMMEALKCDVSGEVMRSNDLGLDGDMIEAECFAYLAVRVEKGLPITFPGTTGVKKPLSGGIAHTP